jgi:hypothetical protein
MRRADFKSGPAVRLLEAAMSLNRKKRGTFSFSGRIGPQRKSKPNIFMKAETARASSSFERRDEIRAPVHLKLVFA